MARRLLIMGLLLVLAACTGDTEERNNNNNLLPNVEQATENALGTAVAQQQAVPTATPLVIAGSTATPLPPTQTSVPTLPVTIQESTAVSTEVLGPTEASTAVAMLEAGALEGDHLWLARPIQASGELVDYGAATYRFGNDGGGRYSIHHGIDMQNPEGTPVVAVVSGRVLFAGNDFLNQLFGPTSNFYGNHVVLEHTITLPTSGLPYTFYTLYGHLSEVSVATGEPVQQYQQIGEVGSTGVAIGPHLHFEVRIDDPYSYNRVLNPDLWLQPWFGFGVLAGRLTTVSGEPLYNQEVQVISQERNRTYRTYTYIDDSVQSDPFYRENFVLPDLPAGDYEVRVGYRGRVAYSRQITISPEETLYLSIQVE